MPYGQSYNPMDDLGEQRNPNTEEPERVEALTRFPRQIRTLTGSRLRAKLHRLCKPDKSLTTKGLEQLAA